AAAADRGPAPPPRPANASATRPFSRNSPSARDGSEDGSRLVDVEPGGEVERPLQALAIGGGNGPGVGPGGGVEPGPVDDFEGAMGRLSEQLAALHLQVEGVVPVLGGGVRALDALDDRVGQQVAGGAAEQALLAAVIGLECPGRVVDVLDEPVVAERDPDL